GLARDRPPTSAREAERPERARRGPGDRRGARLQGPTGRARGGVVDPLPRDLQDDPDRARRPRGARPHGLPSPGSSRGAPDPPRALRPGLLPQLGHLQPPAALGRLLPDLRLVRVHPHPPARRVRLPRRARGLVRARVRLRRRAVDRLLLARGGEAVVARRDPRQRRRQRRLLVAARPARAEAAGPDARPPPAAGWPPRPSPVL